MTTVRGWLHAHADLPRLDLELLISHVMSLSRVQILTHPEYQLTNEQLIHLGTEVAQLREDFPIAYILGQREFWGLSFKVNPAVLIPRPETELLVQWAIERAPQGGRLLDLGTGSGAIAIAIESERRDLLITAVDCSEAALKVAKKNAVDHQSRVTFLNSNWFSNVTGHWDIIVANPPYIAPGDAHLPALQAEPQLALVSPNKGLADLKQIIENSPNYLAPGGMLALEHGYNQAEPVNKMMNANGFTQVESMQDLAFIARATSGRRFRAER